jgi:hypothetical protein
MYCNATRRLEKIAQNFGKVAQTVAKTKKNAEISKQILTL